MGPFDPRSFRYQRHETITRGLGRSNSRVNRRSPGEGMMFSFCSPMIAGMTGLNLGLPCAWVVKCKKCGCTINCRAIDPQIEHSEPEKAELRPQDTVIVTCSCCWAAYRYSPAEVFKGPPGPSSNCYDRGRPNNTVGGLIIRRRKSQNAVS